MTTTIVQVPEDLSLMVNKFTKDLGFANEGEFINEAIRDKILELRRALFFEGSNKVKVGLTKKGFSEKDIIDDFSIKLHS